MGAASGLIKGLGVTLLFTAAGCPLARAGAAIDIQLVTTLPRNEPYEGQLFHDGVLWETHSLQADGEQHRVDVYDAQGQTKIGSVPLTHTASYIYPYSAHQVLVVGKSATPYWQTHFTIITRSGTSFSTRVTDFPEEYMIDQSGGDASALFFNEPGSRGVFRWTSARGLQKIGDDVSGPGAMQSDGRNLWVIERHGPALGDEGLVRIDPVTGSTERTFGNAVRNGLTDLQATSHFPWVAVSEALAEQVLFVDKTTDTLAYTVAVPGTPRGLTQLGGCLLVASEDSKQVTFIALWGDTPHVIDQWDVSAAGDQLKKPRSIAVNPETGRVFLRSTYLCPTCATTQSSVYSAAQTDGVTVRKCLANAR